MNREARKALKESIEHWYRISACMTPAALRKEGYASGSCALCRKWPYNCFEDDGCPVANKTGHSGCIHSPYYAASESLENFENGGKWTKQDQANIEAEIRFLEGLLDE